MQKRFLTILLFVTCAVYAQSPAPIKLVSPTEFSETFAKKGGTILDVRTANEVKKGFIKGSVNIDFFGDDFATRIAKLDKTKPIFVYCAVGGRSAEAAELLAKQGFKLVYDLDGGFSRWKQDGLPVSH